MPSPHDLLAYYVLIINLGAFALFWSDKRRAVMADWRVPERDLLIVAFMGGWPGAKLAQIMLHHKRRELTFGLRLNGIPLVWALLCLALIPSARETVVQWMAA